VIRYTLANEFGTPGHGDYGVGDFPGIDGVTLDGWDLDRGGYLSLSGALTRENAPRLPWTDGVVEIRLRARHEYTSIDVETDENDVDPHQERDLTVVREECRGLANAMERAVEYAVHAALKAGRAEVEYKTSAEYAESEIEANEREFLADGTPYFG
jgi:hypothetical protein